MSGERCALFPGTFDPFTNGHLDLTRRAASLFDRVVVAVAHNPGKGAMFPIEERVEMIRTATRSLRRIEVIDFPDLVVECARRVGAQVMIRGLRAVSDFEFEFQMALMNRRLNSGIEVAFLMPSQQFTYLNSTLVKEVARLGGNIHGLVPAIVERRASSRRRAISPVIASIARVRGAPAAPARGRTSRRADGRAGGAPRSRARGRGCCRPGARLP